LRRTQASISRQVREEQYVKLATTSPEDVRRMFSLLTAVLLAAQKAPTGKKHLKVVQSHPITD
jgi:hypothetical protein